MLEVKLDIVNKKEYEESDTYKEIKIVFPRDIEDLRKDFKYLDLDYDNYTIQDTHILECEFKDNSQSEFAADISNVVNKVIESAGDNGYTTPFQDLKRLHEVLNNLNPNDRNKLLAILEVDEDIIQNIKDVIKYAENTKYFELINTYSYSGLAKKLVNDGDIKKDDLLEYIDLDKLGRDYSECRRMTKTEYGFLEGYFDLSAYKLKGNEEEEEFE